MHSVVIGSQFFSLFLQEHEFVVGQAAANGITGEVLHEAEGDLIDPIVRKI